MQVYINKYDEDPATGLKTLVKEREIITVQLIKENKLTIWVKLPDGHIIKRKKDRDIHETL